MANFKVGQRVKLVAKLKPEHMQNARPCALGIAGTIVRRGIGESMWEHMGDCIVAWDGKDNANHYGGFAQFFYQLAPLTPPAEDTWAADKVRELVKPRPMDAERAPHEWTTERIG